MPTHEETLQEFSKDGKFRKVWNAIKDAILQGDELTKEQQLALAKLYKEFNQGLSGELAKFEKATSSNGAVKHAYRAVKIIEGYRKQVAGFEGDIPKSVREKLDKLLDAMSKILEKSLHQIGTDNPDAQGRFKKIANEARLHKGWAHVKKKTLESKGLDDDDKKELKKLYSAFDSGLSASLKKFEQSKSDEDAIGHAKDAIEVIKTYRKKIGSGNITGDSAITLDTYIAELQEFLEDCVKDLQ